MTAFEFLSRNLIYPAWDIKDGSDRMRQVAFLKESQWWGAEQLQSLQLTRLNAIVEHAASHVPYYQRTLGKTGRLSSLKDLSSLPVLRKREVREFQDQLIADVPGSDSFIAAKTGGSTGVSLSLKFDIGCQRWRNAASIRSDEWAGWRPGMLVGALWGSPELPTNLKQHMRNMLHDRMFYLDTINLNASTMSKFLGEMHRRRPGGLFGHAHSLYVFSRFIEEGRLSPPPVRAIISTSMMLLDVERQVIERAFGCPVTNRYGCEEVGLIASECEQHQGLHTNAEHVIVEILKKDGSPASEGEEGEIVVTDLVNKGMPMIRYAIEDVAAWASGDCPCGRKLRRISRLVGRVADFLIRPDGSFVAGVSLVEKTLTAIPGLEQLQIVQHASERIDVNVVPAADYGPQAEGALRRVLQETFGTNVVVNTRIMDRIPQEKNGKYRFAICNVDKKA